MEPLILLLVIPAMIIVGIIWYTWNMGNDKERKERMEKENDNIRREQENIKKHQEQRQKEEMEKEQARLSGERLREEQRLADERATSERENQERLQRESEERRKQNEYKEEVKKELKQLEEIRKQREKELADREVGGGDGKKGKEIEEHLAKGRQLDIQANKEGRGAKQEQPYKEQSEGLAKLQAFEESIKDKLEQKELERERTQEMGRTR